MNRETYIKIAFWYYSLHMTQEEIANRLNMTRQKVNQIISSLQDQGIVTFHIAGYEEENVELEIILEQKFGLKQVIIASDYQDAKFNQYKVANVAAQYLEEIIKPGDVIGVSWGNMLADVIDNMTYQKRSDCRVIQLVGAQNMGEAALKSDEIAREMANRLDCPCSVLYAPVVVEREETKTMLMQERVIKRSFDDMKSCTIGLFGIGQLSEDATMCRIGYIPKEDIKRLRRDGFTADIGMNPIRLDGSSDNCYMKKRILNADMDCIRSMDEVVAVASGINKAEAILSVLRSGVLNTLIIDETAAKKVISMIGE